MLQGLLKNLLGPAALLMVGALAGSFGTMKLQKPVSVPSYECPDCNCPEPSVSVQPFEVDKIKGLKSFVYNPQFSGSIQVAGVDSTALRKMIDQSMEQAFQRYMISNHKKGRKASKRLDKIDWEAIAREAADRTDKNLGLK